MIHEKSTANGFCLRTERMIRNFLTTITSQMRPGSIWMDSSTLKISEFGAKPMQQYSTIIAVSEKSRCIKCHLTVENCSPNLPTTNLLIRPPTNRQWQTSSQTWKMKIGTYGSNKTESELIRVMTPRNSFAYFSMIFFFWKYQAFLASSPDVSPPTFFGGICPKKFLWMICGQWMNSKSPPFRRKSVRFYKVQ